METPGYLVVVAHKENPVSQFLCRMDGAVYFGNRSFVAPHRVYCNGHHAFRVSFVSVALFDRGLNDLATLILAALRADAVRRFRLVAVGAFGVGGLAQRVMGAAVLRARVGVSSFRIRHYVLLSY